MISTYDLNAVVISNCNDNWLLMKLVEIVQWSSSDILFNLLLIQSIYDISDSDHFNTYLLNL